MNILISHTSLYKKNGWGRIFPLAEGLVKLGNEVTILTTNTGFSLFTKMIFEKNVRILIYPEVIPARVSKMGFGFFSLILKIIHVLFHKYDVVHSDNGHRPLSGIPCRLHKKLYSSVYVAEWYDWYGIGGQYDNKKKLFKLLLGPYELKTEIKDKKTADGVVVLSEVLRQRALEFKSDNRIVKIHGGADVSNIPFLKDNSELKLKYKYAKDTLTLGYINSDSYRTDEFLPILNSIISNGLGKRVRVLVFGKYDLLVKQLPPDLAEIITFYGWIDYVRDYEKLQLVDVFFLFKEETLGNKAGWPNCIGDYLACGRHILINPVGEVVEFAGKHPYAFIITRKNEDSINKHFKELLANRKKMEDERNEIRRLAEVVSWESKSRQLEEFYLRFKSKRGIG